MKKINKRTHIISIILITFFMISNDFSSATMQVDKEWKVKVGDSITYTLDKLYDESDSDGDGNKNTQTNEITDEDGNKVNVTTKKGSKMKVTITKLNDVAAVNREWFDDGVISEETSDQSVVTKTVDDKAYWQEEVIDMSVGDTEATTQGNLVILNTTSIELNIKTKFVKKNWKSGWKVYEYFKIFNKTYTDYELEFSGEISAVGAPGIEIVPIVFSIIVISLIGSKKRK